MRPRSSPRLTALSSPSVNASSARAWRWATTSSSTRPAAINASAFQPRKLVLPSMKACLPRKASGEATVMRSLNAPSNTPTTTPASSRRRVCTAPRASVRVMATPINAPRKATVTSPTRSSQTTVDRLMVEPPRAAAASTSTTPRPAPAALPNR